MRPFVLGVWLLTPAAVFACSGSVCFYTPAVGDGALPANVSGIVFTTLGGPGPDFDATDAGFELFRDTGEQVANTLEVSASGTQIVLRPRDAFDAGASFVVR